jgi:hypothetical protein
MENTAKAKAESYGMTTTRPFFPVNSLRLLYYFLSDFYTNGNPDVREKITQLITVIEAIFEARTKSRTTGESANPQKEYEIVKAQFFSLFTIVDTPKVRHILEELFVYLYPLQDELFFHFYQEVFGQKELSSQHLLTLLKVRAMDSVVFSTIISELITLYLAENFKTEQESIYHSLTWHINLAYQINDMVDAIVYAKDDLAAENFSPFRVIQKITADPASAKELIQKTLQDLQKKAEIFPFPEPLQAQVVEFYTELVSVVVGK